MSLADWSGDHGEHCSCLDCFCGRQLSRVVKTLRNVDRRRSQRWRERQRDLGDAHDEMYVGSRTCAPSLDYYDNRRPSRG